jgi:hypothetical protein
MEEALHGCACPKLGQLAAFIQQRVRHGYRRQRPSEGGGNTLLDFSVPYF